MNRPAPAERELRFAGEIASRGLADGRLVILGAAAPAVGSAPARGTPGEEAARLNAAIEGAVAGLQALLDGLDEQAAGMVAFQIAMLGDESVAAPAHGAIRAGAAADAAWHGAMAALVADYESADDPYFRARASDIADIRERVLRALSGERGHAIPPRSIVLADDLTPTAFLAADWTGSGIVLRRGSASGHVALLARARGVPMLVGTGARAEGGEEALLDAEEGLLVVAPSQATRAAFLRSRAKLAHRAEREAAHLAHPATTARGERVKVLVNVAGPDDLAAVDPRHCDGIGLVRTEFLFHDAAGLPDEEIQFEAYRRVVGWAGGRPVTFRTLDAGGDKPIRGLTLEGESNPFLGVRGLRLSLRRPDVFLAQLRALLRAAACGPVRIMLPMVTAPEEVEAARGLLRRASGELEAAGVEAGHAQLGIMVEVPAAAIAIDRFSAEFLSIGSNDLVQYVTACGRDVAGLGALARPDDPAVMRLIEHVVRHADVTGIEVGICGDMAGEPRFVPLLLGCGLRALSVAPAALAATKAAVAAYGG